MNYFIDTEFTESGPHKPIDLIVSNGTTSLTIGEPSNPLQQAALEMVQKAVDLNRATLRKSPDGLIITIEES